MIAFLFWAAVLAVLHTYVFYPLLLILLDGFEQARGAWRYISGSERRRPPAQLGLPHVSVLIAAYNEASCIGQRIENLLAQDYPAEHLEILVGSDDSTDGTDAIVQHYAARGVKLSRADRSGKADGVGGAPTVGVGDVVSRAGPHGAVRLELGGVPRRGQSPRRLGAHRHEPEARAEGDHGVAGVGLALVVAAHP